MLERTLTIALNGRLVSGTPKEVPETSLLSSIIPSRWMRERGQRNSPHSTRHGSMSAPSFPLPRTASSTANGIAQCVPAGRRFSFFARGYLLTLI